MSKKLRVGFDFDGVIAYNPLRVLRKPGNYIMNRILGKGVLDYYPEASHSKTIWKLLHKTSLFPAPGFTTLKKLLHENKIEGYIITGRYSLLENDLHHWLVKHNSEHLFKKIYINRNNLNPAIFKESMIEKLKLDHYVEDNWDVVRHLNGKSDDPKSSIKTDIHWIYNIIDHFIPYKNKHPHLSSFLKTIINSNSD